MAEHEDDDVNVVPMPDENEAERLRIRRSNDYDQKMERLGNPSKHNSGYDEAADGVSRPEIVHIADE